MSIDQSESLGAPFVSCIMPTRNRRPFVSQSIWYFQRQDYPNKELVVLDDREDDVADLIPDDERIRYGRVDRQVLGAKRNLGCELSRGEFIAHWDEVLDDPTLGEGLTAAARDYYHENS